MLSHGAPLAHTAHALQEFKTYKDSFMRKFQLVELPDYLVVCIKRFTKNTFFVEKNGTIVNFPVK